MAIVTDALEHRIKVLDDDHDGRVGHLLGQPLFQRALNQPGGGNAFTGEGSLNLGEERCVVANPIGVFIEPGHLHSPVERSVGCKSVGDHGDEVRLTHSARSNKQSHGWAVTISEAAHEFDRLGHKGFSLD